MALLPSNEPLVPQTSRWVNPTSDTLKVDIHVGGAGARRSPYARYVWNPGETKELPVEFERALHVYSEDGTIVGGLAPQLRKVTEPDAKVHPALDVEAQAHKEALDSAQEALLAKKAADDALVIAGARLASDDAKAKAAPAAAPKKS